MHYLCSAENPVGARATDHFPTHRIRTERRERRRHRIPLPFPIPSLLCVFPGTLRGRRTRRRRRRRRRNKAQVQDTSEWASVSHGDTECCDDPAKHLRRCIDNTSQIPFAARSRSLLSFLSILSSSIPCLPLCPFFFFFLLLLSLSMIQFLLLVSRQGKIRLSKWYSFQPRPQQIKIAQEGKEEKKKKETNKQ
jgi:hypothetical protein